MILLTTFLTIGFVSTSIILCWLSDKYSETLDELENYKRQTQIKENRRIYKNDLQSYKKGTQRNSKTH